MLAQDGKNKALLFYPCALPAFGSIKNYVGVNHYLLNILLFPMAFPFGITFYFPFKSRSDAFFATWILKDKFIPQ